MTCTEPSKEIFSFHLAHLSLLKVPRFLFWPAHRNKISGLSHSESFFTMNLGEPILSTSRYNPKTVAFLARWNEESFLDDFLKQPGHRFLADGWHVRMRLYRKWGEVTELRDAIAVPNLVAPAQSVVAVTLARLKILEAPRFIKWGMAVERQVRDHRGQTLALAAMRPFNTFSTFSVWKNESEMLMMVGGGDHKLAMQERLRKDFHYEFTTMRFAPFKEIGSWNGKSDFTSCSTK